MRQAWRWYGPDDPVTLDHVRQAGATEIVSALHQYAPGEVWPQKAVAERKAVIENTPPGRSQLKWTVVESIPVPDDILRGGASAARQTEIWIESMRAVAAVGIRTICYNVMPVVDWTRTDLDYPMPTGATALRFDYDRFAAFDLHVLKRKGAEADYDEATRARARKVADALSQGEAELLTKNISAGLPGATTFSQNLDAFRERITSYGGITLDKMRANVAAFLAQVTPVAEALDVRLTLHPDDPPRPIFGLPRIASTRADYEALFKAVPSRANGICFCVGSLGSRPDNDVVAMARDFGPRIYFAHLRATQIDDKGKSISFTESDHLDGDVNMIDVLRMLIAENRKRDDAWRIPFRPDHGHRMLDDIEKTRINPGYTGIGRLKGLAELRGAIRALQ
ncbi:MAG: mannonate dehydratase [Hyphomicrobiales bacterium]|jgi:mannonate dehydratase|nr:mannonate dehydratase [Hyphomicrobiales bacterium]